MKPIVKAFLLSLLCVNLLQAEVKGLTSIELENYIKLGIKIIDARKPETIKQTGLVPTSYRVGFYTDDGTIDKDKWLLAFVQILRDKKLKFVLITQKGERAEKGAYYLSQKGFLNPYYLIGGFEAWEKANKKIIHLKE